MPTEAVITITISAIALVFSIYSWLKSARKTDTKEIEERVKENTRINFKLDTIAGTTQDIKTEISSMRDDIKSHNDRLIKVEESCKSAHHRLNTIEERLNAEKEE